MWGDWDKEGLIERKDPPNLWSVPGRSPGQGSLFRDPNREIDQRRGVHDMHG